MWVFWQFRDVVDLYFQWHVAVWSEYGWNPWEMIGNADGTPQPSDTARGIGFGTLVTWGQDALYSHDLGKDVVISSVRMKAWRRGIQDYEALWTANERGVLDTNWVNDASARAGFDDYRTLSSYSLKPNEPLPYHIRGYKYEAVRKEIYDAIGDVDTTGDGGVPAPDAPANLTYTGLGRTSLTAEWSASAGADYYKFDLATDAAFASMVGIYNNYTVNTTSLSLSGLSRGTKHWFRVRAVDENGTSPNSATGTAVTFRSLRVHR
jgi:hypothetical protein